MDVPYFDELFSLLPRDPRSYRLGRLMYTIGKIGNLVPRVRGVCCMKYEVPFKEDEINAVCEEAYAQVYDLEMYFSKEDVEHSKEVAQKAKERTREQFLMFNKYCGREDILLLHTRLGGVRNYEAYEDSIKKIPNVIDKIEDGTDFTYCD